MAVHVLTGKATYVVNSVRFTENSGMYEITVDLIDKLSIFRLCFSVVKKMDSFLDTNFVPEVN